MRFFMFGQLLLLSLTLTSCQGAGDPALPGNDSGSQPVNPTEELAYKRAILKCYKTGGSRVVKIEGQLMCY